MRHWLTASLVAIVACSDSAGAVGGSSPEGGGGQSNDAGAGPAGGDGGVTGGNAGAGGAPSGDAACPAGALFCESFEGDTLDAASWGTATLPAGFELDKSGGWHGAHALRVFMGSDYGVVDPHQLPLQIPIAAPEDRIYARWFMRFSDLKLPGYHPNFVTIVSSDFDIGNWPMYEQHSFGSFAGSFSVNHLGPQLDQALLWGGFDSETPWLGDSTPDTEQSLAAGEWFCVELMVYGGDQGPGDTSHSDEETIVWIDGVEIDELHASHDVWQSPEHWSPRFDGSRWSFGIAGAYTADTTTELWYDAIAFAHERIGCGEGG